jgi:uncharacterized protein (DUF736 family)
MANKYGTLQKQGNPQQPYTGKIVCPLISGSLVLNRVEKVSPKSPNYEVLQRVGGELMEVGSAWTKPMEKGGCFLSITIDGPHMDKPLNVSAFPKDGNAEVLEIVWQRPRKQEVNSTQEAA